MSSSSSASRFGRRDAVLGAVAVLVIAGLFDLGYIMGARAPHPNSPWTMVGITLIGAIGGLLLGLWFAAAPTSADRSGGVDLTSHKSGPGATANRPGPGHREDDSQ